MKPARSRAIEAERGRAEADLVAALALELLGGAHTSHALPAASRLVAEAFALPTASIILGEAGSGARRDAVALRDADDRQVATLVVPPDLPADTTQRLQTVAPALGAIVARALRRDAIQTAAVESEALLRSDEIKTAILRAVSNDLLTPLSAIVAAGQALRSGALTSAERAELSDSVVGEGERLAGVVEKLLDLSRLQAGPAEPHRDSVSLGKVLLAARASLRGDGVPVRITIEPDLPAILADGAQLERAFANLLENARRYSGGHPVSAQARRGAAHIQVRVVDEGPGIAPGERARIFEPFYRGSSSGTPGAGSGLGLAIAKGYVEANGGTISVEPLPGQGTSFIVSLPLERPVLAPLASQPIPA